MKENKKGFTLIELLAVIVVLAIVSVLGASIILPALADARKNAFVSEANNFLEAASEGISLIQVGSITNAELTAVGSDYKKTSVAASGTTPAYTTYCFTLNGLIKLGLFDKKLDSTGKVPNYNGKVSVRVNDGSKQYIYTTTFSNKDFYVNNVTGNITATNVVEYATNETFSSKSLSDTCS